MDEFLESLKHITSAYVCEDCGGEVQRRYSAWWYERDGALVLAEHDDGADCMESWCPACGEQVCASPSDAVDPAVVQERIWQDDGAQFTRLLAEIWAADAVSAQAMRGLSASMDLPIERIEELFTRAERAFESMKPKGEEGR
jgi:hypothetical protein